MLKLQRLFYTSVGDDAFDDAIEPTEAQRAALEDAKNEVRDYLRPRIRAATVTVLKMDKAIEPRFRTQGSWRYRTCIQVAWPGVQEMDWDFGVYMPVTVWEDNGPPSDMAKAYFELVERLLKDLCAMRGWQLEQGKSTCIRVRVNAGAHLDIPLYAAPEREFELILERALRTQFRKAVNDSADALTAAGELAEQEWDELDHLVLATRTGEWKSSDPEMVTKWFLDRVVFHTDQLRRVCRYLKAWRDYHWQVDGPTSICIMVVVAQGFEAHRGRDDLALRHAARRLAQALLGEVREWGIDKGAEDFNRGLSGAARAEAAAKARVLAEVLDGALSAGLTSHGEVFAALQQQFGGRIPSVISYLESDDGGDRIREVPARTVPQPIVRPTRAG